MMPDIPNPAVIVVALDSMQGLQTARVFARHKVPVIGVATDRKYYACKTNTCETIHFVDTGGEDLVNLLSEIGPSFSEKPLLVPCRDECVLIISEHRKSLSNWYRLVLPDHDVILLLVDKVQFYEYAQANGLRIPETFFLRCRADAQQAARRLRYPCVLKPPFRPEAWIKHTKQKALVAADEAEFLALYDHYGRWADVLIGQNWIRGPESNLYSCNCYFNDNSKPLATFVARKLRQWPPETGQSCLGEEVRADEVLKETLRLFELVGYCGLGYLELKRDEVDGDYYIVEPNVGRPTGRSAIAEAGGVEILFTMYCDVFGLPLPENREQKYTNVKWIHILRDLQAAIHHWRRGQLSLRQWRESVRGRKTFAVFSWKDPRPFISAVLQAVPTLLSSRERGSEDLAHEKTKIA